MKWKAVLDSLVRQQQVEAPWYDLIALFSLKPKCQSGPRWEIVSGSNSQGRTGCLHQMMDFHTRVRNAGASPGCFAIPRGFLPRKALAETV